VDGALVASKGAAAQAAGLPAASVAPPALADAVGTNLFDPQARHVTFVLGGGRATFDLVRVPSIQVTLTLSMSSGEFFNPQTVVTNLALLLNIDASRVRVVSVHSGTGGLGRRLGGGGGDGASGSRALQAPAAGAGNVSAGAVSGGALAVGVEIIDAAPAVLVTSAPLDNATSASGNASLAQQLRMVALASSLTALAQSGQVSAATIGYAVAALTVVPPTVTAATGEAAAAIAAAGAGGSGPSTPIVLVPAKKATAAPAGLSGGAVAGVVCGVLVGVALVAGAAMLLLRRRDEHVEAAAAAMAAEQRRADAQEQEQRRAAKRGSVLALPGEGDVGGVNPNFRHILPSAERRGSGEVAPAPAPAPAASPGGLGAHALVLPGAESRAADRLGAAPALAPLAAKRAALDSGRPLSFRVVAQPEQVASKASARARASQGAGAPVPATHAAAAADHTRAAWH